MDINAAPPQSGPNASHIFEEKQIVVPHHPEVVPISYPTLEAVHPGQLPGEIYAYYEPVRKPRRWCGMSKLKIWLTTSVLIAIVTAIALGTALGITLSKRKVESGNSQSATSTPSSLNSSPSASPFATTSSIPSPTAKPTSIATLSPLAVTAWRNMKAEDEFSIQLVFQDDQDGLQSIVYNTTFNKWQQKQIGVVAKKGTPLAITRFYQGQYYVLTDTQVELFYIDQKNRLSEWNWDWNSNNFRGARGSIDEYNVTVASSSRLSAYWPFIYYQDQDDSLHEIKWAPYWQNQSIGTKVYQEGAALGVVPIAQNIATMGVFYQGQDGRVKEVQRDDKSNGYSYDAHSLSLSVPLPSANAPSPFTAFALTNLTTAYAINTYILYQDASATIQMQWRYDETGWKGPKTFDAFKGADNGTGIACITMDTAASSEPILRVETDIPRCYFQSGGNVREVEMVRDDGKEGDWRVLGYLPIA